jgi:hypothetical protein
MRVTLRELALSSLAVFILALAVAISQYLENPCPSRFFFQLYLVLFGGLMMLPMLVGSVWVVAFAVSHRQWGWLVAQLAAAVFSLVFLYAAAMDAPPPTVLAITTTLSQAFDHGFSLASCGSRPSLYVQSIATTLPLLSAPLLLLGYSFSTSLSQSPRVTAKREFDHIR